MNKQQADDWATLAYFIRDQVPERNLDQESFLRIAAGESKDKLMQPECKSTCCTWGWAAMIWPERFAWDDNDKPEVPFLAESQRWFLNEQQSEMFGLTLSEAMRIFGPTQRTPKQQFRQMQKVAFKYGWEI